MRMLLAALALVACTAASAQDITVEGAARTVTSLIAIKSACGKLMAVNQDKASKLAVGIIHQGEKLYGKRTFDLAYAKDIDRRRTEVDATGAQQWCAYQRGYLQSIGLTGIFLN